jgi:hypothetical protein
LHVIGEKVKLSRTLRTLRFNVTVEESAELFPYTM